MSDQKNDEQAPHGPRVIDLEAEEIRTEADARSSAAAEEDRREAPREEWLPPPSPAPKRKTGGAAGWIIAGLVVGALGGGWLYRDVLASYLPSSEMTALAEKLGALEVNNRNLENRFAALQQTVQGASDSAAAAKDASAAPPTDHSSSMAHSRASTSVEPKPSRPYSGRPPRRRR